MGGPPEGPDDTREAMISPSVRRLGLLWVCVSLPVTVAVSAWADSPGSYVFVLVWMASGAYTAPGLVVGWYAVRRVVPDDRVPYALLYAGLVTVFAIGVGMLIGLATGWRWGNVLGVPAVLVAGLAHTTGLTILVRSRSGRRAVSVDVLEAMAAVVATIAPLAMLWGPAVLRAEASWYAVPSAVAAVFALWGMYWALTFFVRLGPGRGVFEVSAVILGLVGALNAVLQTVQGVSGFTLPVPPLIALHALCFSSYLLIPLYVPQVLRSGLDRLPPQAQVRGASIPGLVTLAGLVALVVVTVAVVDERPGAVPFSMGVISVLCGLGCLRQMAAAGETRRLYRQVEQAAEERHQLLSQLVERSGHDRRRFAGHLYEQAVAAYASFRVLAGSEAAGSTGTSAVGTASEVVVGDLARRAESVREVVLAIRATEGEGPAARRWAVPLQAYLAALYGDRPAPRFTVAVADDVVPSWVAETVLLHIAHEALRNVWQHSGATTVDLAVRSDGDGVVLQVCDDGVGFDPAAVPEGAGITTMRTAAAAGGGTLVVDASPGAGVTVEARLGAGGAASPPPGEDSGPRLRLIRGQRVSGD